MTTAPTNTSFYADFQSLSALKKDAHAEQPAALRKVAQEFESLFVSMMLKSMREATASIGDGEFGNSNEMDLYQGMFDQQIATQMSRGKGIGLADMLVRQLAHSQQSEAATGSVSLEAITATQSEMSPRSSDATPQAFVQSMLPQAQAAAERLGVDPALLVAQAALETGWGSHVPANANGASSFNLFGIKASSSWQGAQITQLTREYSNGEATTQVAAFRSYDSLTDAFADYSQVLAQPRYAALRDAGSDAQRFAQALQSGGYATDPQYANKLLRVIDRVRDITSQGALHEATLAAAASGEKT